jgi:hypothetical protein
VRAPLGNDPHGNPFVEGYSLGSLSMACYTLGLPIQGIETIGRPAAGLPDPDVIRPEDTNL